MKSKVPAIILALGISASPVFAKNTNRRAEAKDISKIEENKLAQKRVENSYIRKKRIELEKEFIRETEEEINKVLSNPFSKFSSEKSTKERKMKIRELLLEDKVPVNGIDISEEFKKISKL